MGPWSKVTHYIGNRLPFGKHTSDKRIYLSLGSRHVRPGNGFVPNFLLFQRGDVNGDTEQGVYTFLKVSKWLGYQKSGHTPKMFKFFPKSWLEDSWNHEVISKKSRKSPTRTCGKLEHLGMGHPSGDCCCHPRLQGVNDPFWAIYFLPTIILTELLDRYCVEVTVGKITL